MPSDPTADASIDELANLVGDAAKGASAKIAEARQPEAPADTSSIDPSAVEAASAKLVDAGLLPAPTSTVTPELKKALESVVSKQYPGMYDLNNPDDLSQVLDHVASGQLQLSDDPFGGAGERPDAGDSSEWGL